VYGANLTADPETGLGKRTIAAVTQAIVNGIKRTGGTLSPLMPWPYYAGRVTDADASALVAFLRTPAGPP
jgi:hypothetical protein